MHSLKLLSLVRSSTLTLCEDGDCSGRQLVWTNSDSTLVDDGFDDASSAVRVTGICEWILYEHPKYGGASSVVGGGDQDYLYDYEANRTTFGLPNDALSSIHCLPSPSHAAIALFQHDHYRGNMQILSSHSEYLGNFDNTVSSFIIISGLWQLYPGTNYTGSSVTKGVGHYPTPCHLSPVSDDDLSSVNAGKLMCCELFLVSHGAFTEIVAGTTSS